jgi:hypothetical protein
VGEKGTAGYEAMKRGLLPPEAKPDPHPMLHGGAVPIGGSPGPVMTHWQVDPNDPDHAFDPSTGRNLTWDEDKQQWIDTKTGEPVGQSAATPLE